MRELNNKLKNPVGLGAGFDKNARYLRELEALGFGFVEVGTVTPLGQDGNEKPRLFRLPADKALINRMGFNNDGVALVAERLKKWQQRAVSKQEKRMLIGGNIGKNKQTANEEAWKDYVACFKALNGLVDYFVVNVSSPNTPGLRALQDKESLRKIFTELNALKKQLGTSVPVLLKIAPDLEWAQVDDVLALAPDISLDGLIVANTSISRTDLNTSEKAVSAIGLGGLSGRPIAGKSTAMLQYIKEKTGGQLFLMGSGGIFNGADAAEKMAAGASWVQVWTGFVYAGPSIVKNISAYLASNSKNKLPGIM